MVIFSLLLEKGGEEYYYRYISENITYYIPSYKTDRLNKPVSDYEIAGDYSYSSSITGFLNKVYELGEFTEVHQVNDIKNTKEVSIIVSGYKYNNYIILVGSHQSGTLLEDTLFKEDYIFLVRWVDSKEDYIDDISDNVLTLLEYTREELLAKPYIELIYKDDRYTFKQELNKYIEKNSPSFYQKYRLVSKSGKTITVLDHSCQIFKDNKKRIVGYLRDITLETEMSTKLKELVTLDETNFNSDILIKIEWDKDFKITRWNSEANNSLGWNESIVGKSLQDTNLFSEEDTIKMQNQFKRLFSREVDNVVSSYRVQKRQGGFIDTKWGNKLIHRNGELRILSSVIDRSQETLLTNRLDEMESRTDLLLKTLSETKLSNDVFANLVHNPLTSNPEGLIKAEIIIRKLEEEITRINNIIFYNNDNNLLNDVAFLKNEDNYIRERITKLEEDSKKLSELIEKLSSINILTTIKNINSKNILTFIVIGYIIFGQVLPSIYPTIIKPWYIKLNKELKHIGGKD